MIRSMTGFARLERQFEFGRLSWEMRSVNHRFLECSLRLPEEVRTLDPAIRELLGRHLARGKIDATLRFQPAGGAAAGRLELNRDLAGKLVELYREFAGLAAVEPEPPVPALMRWPGVIEEQLPDAAPMQEAALALLAEATAELQAARGREGEKMAAALRERLQGVQEWTARIREWLPEIRAGLRDRLLGRIGELQQPLDPGRLEQEVAFLAQKIDIDEELDRLLAHVSEARRVLEVDEPVGRRLDFLMQEFNRESNTLSSKSIDQRTTQAAVELKVLIEQMREQIQNVE